MITELQFKSLIQVKFNKLLLSIYACMTKPRNLCLGRCSFWNSFDSIHWDISCVPQNIHTEECVSWMKSHETPWMVIILRNISPTQVLT